MRVARRWGCTPAELRACSWADYSAMYELLLLEQQQQSGS